MAVDLDIEDKDSEITKRITDLSGKVKSTSEERDNAIKEKDEMATKAAVAEKERDFYSGFADTIAQYPNAKDHKDEIKAKVLSGYTVEDATVSVLAKAGKLTTEVRDTTGSLGGSATTVINAEVKKTPAEMNQAEKRAALADNLEWA